MGPQHESQTQDLTEEVTLLRQEVFVLRESIDEFRDDLVHVLRLIADQFGCHPIESASPSWPEPETQQLDEPTCQTEEDTPVNDPRSQTELF